MAKAKKTEDDLFAEIREEVKAEPKPKTTTKTASKTKAMPQKEEVKEVKPEPKPEVKKIQKPTSKFSQDGGDFEAILELPEVQMKEAIEKLPKGCKECVKGIVATKVDEGSLDSVKKIKALDEIFGTNLLLTLANN